MRSLLILTLALVSGPAWGLETPCAADEAVLFACTTGKKAVAVCASADLSPTEGALQYRFGPPGAPELVWPEDPQPPHTDVTAGTLMFSGGGGAYLRFTKGAYVYVVYTAIGKGWSEKAGVVVEKNGESIAHLPCTGAVVSELGPVLFEQASLVEDEQGFDLP
ncbi:MAG: hypothetical protein KDJ28_07375 [Candidatus Competibacteraceae bacterium]|nr:hypothetical protein [Candidatus Competibacteraceae bacterium]